MRDRSAGGSRNTPPAADGTGQPPDPQSAQDLQRNLTQELAQLLAASIAHSQQSGRLPPGGVPTNSELASLASIVSASIGQRTPAPPFKDGLSSLSLANRARHGHAAEPLDAGHDDEPMPIPSTWREPRLSDDDRWYRQQMGAALLGLLAGLMIVVPTVLWLSGWFDPQQAKLAGAGRLAASATGDARPAEPRTVRAASPQGRAAEPAQAVTGSVELRPAAADEAKPVVPPPPVPVVSTARLVDPRERLDEVLAAAARRIEAGDVLGAREVLAGADDGTQGAVTFALAETFDPNMLAAWGSRGVSADVAKARALYRKALSLGAARAQARLDALQ